MPTAAAMEKLLLKAIDPKDAGDSQDYSKIPELEIYRKDVNFVNLKAQMQMLSNLLKTYNEYAD